MERPTCETCPYYHAGFLQCRRHAPPVGWKWRPQRAESNEFLDFHWPEVAEDEWCGEHPDFPLYLMWRRDSDLDDDEPDDAPEVIKDLEARVSAIEAALDAERTLRIEQSERS
jgi:hypothetical protein